MATEETLDDTSAEDTSDQDQQDLTDDTSGTEDQQDTTTVDKSARLPDDHPVVKQLAADKAKLAKANAELAELRAKSSKLTELEAEIEKRPSAEALETLQTRYDRLEGFLNALDGPISRILDSRTYSKRLLETDESIEDIVKDWHKANPSTTSQALGSKGAGPTKSSPTMNEILRAARKGS